MEVQENARPQQIAVWNTILPALGQQSGPSRDTENSNSKHKKHSKKNTVKKSKKAKNAKNHKKQTSRPKPFLIGVPKLAQS